MRVFIGFSVDVLVTIIVLLECVNGADIDACASNKSVENQVVLKKDNSTLMIKSPATQQSPQHKRMSCAWQFTAPPGYSVAIEYKFRLNRWSENCSEENVKIYDGTSSSDVLLLENCKSKPNQIDLPVMIYSSRESARIVLKTGNHPNISYFQVSVDAVKRPVPACTNNSVISLVASSTVATFKSPYYPSGYPRTASCGWKIEAPQGKFVKLEFKDLRVECDAILVYDGEDAKQENLIKRFCYHSREGADAIYSFGQSLFVKFKNSSKITYNFYAGFRALYSAVEQGTMCSTNISSNAISNPISTSTTSGNISTPGFPSDVPSKAMTCVWLINVPVGYVIKLDLITINVYQYPCPRVTVKNGHDFTMRRLQCNDFMSETLVSDGRKLQVMYSQPEGKKEGPIGLIAKYSAVPLEKTGSCSANHSGTINMKGETATFHSLNYPNLHPYNMDCTWNITVTAGQVIELRFDTDLDSDCNKEWVRVYDGSTKSSPVIATLCSYNSWNNWNFWYSSSNRVLVEFISTTRSKGFTATYVARKVAPKPYACTRKYTYLNGTEGKLASKGFPQSYGNNVYCNWEITVPFRHIAKVTIMWMDLQPDPNCTKDSVTVIGRGDTYLSEVFAKMCGKRDKPSKFKSKNRKMTVKFRSDATGRYPGFEAKYEALLDTSFGSCTKQYVNNIIPLSSSRGFIFTPRYPLPYPSYMRCAWQIKVPKGKIVRLTFQKFDLNSCEHSYVELKDGEGASSKLIKKLCGADHSEPLVIKSSGSRLWVQFNSSRDFDSHSGFIAQFEAQINELTIVLISVFSVLAVIGLLVLIGWMYKSKSCCFASRKDGSDNDYDAMNLKPNDNVI